MTVIVDNTGFNVAYWSRFTEAEFVSQNLREGVFNQYPESNRRELLKQTFKLIQDHTPRTTETT